MIKSPYMSGLKTLNQIQKHNKKTMNEMEKLSSGLRINKAADDVAGFAISQKMKAQIRGLEQAKHNIQDGVSLLQTAENGIASIQNPNLMRLRELAVYASNGTLTDEDRQYIQNEVDQIKKSIDDIANQTTFNQANLLNVSSGEPNPEQMEIQLQIGANASDTFHIELSDVRSSALGIEEVKIDPIEKAREAISKLDEAIKKASVERSKFGLYQNELDRAYNIVSNTSMNLTEIESRISGVDMAKGVMEYTKSNLLNQAAQAILAQANQQQANVLELLK